MASSSGEPPAQNLPQLLVDYKFEHPDATHKEVGDHFGISAMKVKNTLRKARDDGVVAKGELAQKTLKDLDGAPSGSPAPASGSQNGFYAGFKGKLTGKKKKEQPRRLHSPSKDDEDEPPVEEKFPWLRDLPDVDCSNPDHMREAAEHLEFNRQTVADTSRRRTAENQDGTEQTARNFFGEDKADFDKKREFLFKNHEELFEKDPSDSSRLVADNCRHGGPPAYPMFINVLSQCLLWFRKSSYLFTSQAMVRYQDQRAQGGRQSGAADTASLEQLSFLWHFWTDSKNEKALHGQGKAAPLVLYSQAADAVINNEFGAAREHVTLGHWLAEYLRLGKKKFCESYVRPGKDGFAVSAEKTDLDKVPWFKNLRRTSTDPGLVYFLADTLTCNCLKKFAEHVRSFERKHGTLRSCSHCSNHKSEKLGCVCPNCDAWYCSGACLELDRRRHLQVGGCETAQKARQRQKAKEPGDLMSSGVSSSVPTSAAPSGATDVKTLLQTSKLIESQEYVTKDFMAGWMKARLERGDRSVVIDIEEREEPFFQLLYGSGAEMERVVDRTTRKGGYSWRPKAALTPLTDVVGEFNLAQRKSGGSAAVPRLTSWADAREYVKKMGAAQREIALSVTSEFFGGEELPTPISGRIRCRWQVLQKAFESLKAELRTMCEANARRPCRRSNTIAARGPKYAKEQDLQHPIDASDIGWRNVDAAQRKMRPAELIDLLNILLVWEGARPGAEVWQTQNCPYGQWMEIYVRDQDLVLEALSAPGSGAGQGVEGLDEAHLLFGRQEKLLLKHIAKVVPVQYRLDAWEAFFPRLFWAEVLRRAGECDAAQVTDGSSSSSSSSPAPGEGKNPVPRIWSPARLPWKLLSGDFEHFGRSLYVFSDRSFLARALGPAVVSALGGNLENNVLDPVFLGPESSLGTNPDLAPLAPFLAPTRNFDREKFQDTIFTAPVKARINGYPFVFDPNVEGNGGRGDNDVARGVGVRSEHPAEYTLSIGFNSARMWRDFDVREMSSSYKLVRMVVDEELFEKKEKARSEGDDGEQLSIATRWQRTEDMVTTIIEVVRALGEDELGLEISVSLWTDFGSKF